jgi:hypothetical protein
MSPRKPHYTSLEDLYSELDHESLFDDEETTLLDDEDLALIQTPKTAPAKKPAKARQEETGGEETRQEAEALMTRRPTFVVPPNIPATIIDRSRPRYRLFDLSEEPDGRMLVWCEVGADNTPGAEVSSRACDRPVRLHRRPAVEASVLSGVPEEPEGHPVRALGPSCKIVCLIS